MLIGHDFFRVTSPRPLYRVGHYRVVPQATTPAMGFRMGGWLRYTFNRQRRWFVQPELSYSRSQTWHHVTNLLGPQLPLPGTPGPTDFQTMQATQDWQRLNVALPLGRRIGRHGLLLAGPVLSQRIPTGYERQQQDHARRIVDSIDRSMRRPGLGVQLGGGLAMGRVTFTGRYERSLLNVASEIELDGQQYAFPHYASQFSLALALRVAPHYD